MADLENKLKETAEKAVDVAKDTVEGVKEEGKEFVEEVKAAVKGEKLESASEEGGAGYRAKGGKPTALEVASLVLAIFAVYLGGILGIVFGAVATVLGAKARKDNQTTLATCGFALGAVSVVLGVLRLIF